MAQPFATIVNPTTTTTLHSSVNGGTKTASSKNFVDENGQKEDLPIPNLSQLTSGNDILVWVREEYVKSIQAVEDKEESEYEIPRHPDDQIVLPFYEHIDPESSLPIMLPPLDEEDADDECINPYIPIETRCTPRFELKAFYDMENPRPSTSKTFRREIKRFRKAAAARDRSSAINSTRPQQTINLNSAFDVRRSKRKKKLEQNNNRELNQNGSEPIVPEVEIGRNENCAEQSQMEVQTLVESEEVKTGDTSEDMEVVALNESARPKVNDDQTKLVIPDRFALMPVIRLQHCDQPGDSVRIGINGDESDHHCVQPNISGGTALVLLAADHAKSPTRQKTVNTRSTRTSRSASRPISEKPENGSEGGTPSHQPDYDGSVVGPPGLAKKKWSGRIPRIKVNLQRLSEDQIGLIQQNLHMTIPAENGREENEKMDAKLVMDTDTVSNQTHEGNEELESVTSVSTDTSPSSVIEEGGTRRSARTKKPIRRADNDEWVWYTPSYS